MGEVYRDSGGASHTEMKAYCSQEGTVGEERREEYYEEGTGRYYEAVGEYPGSHRPGQRSAVHRELDYLDYSVEHDEGAGGEGGGCDKEGKDRIGRMDNYEKILRESDQLEEEGERRSRDRSADIKERRARLARERYHKMSEEERRVYNKRRRLRALGLDENGEKLTQETARDIKEANRKKAIAARERYRHMSEEERREHNRKRTEAFRRRRMEEEMLLSTPAGKISTETFHKAQHIMIRNARKAEAARARYQRMSEEERREYNQRRAQSKRARDGAGNKKNKGKDRISDDSMMQERGGQGPNIDGELDDEENFLDLKLATNKKKNTSKRRTQTDAEMEKEIIHDILMEHQRVERQAIEEGLVEEEIVGMPHEASEDVQPRLPPRDYPIVHGGHHMENLKPWAQQPSTSMEHSYHDDTAEHIVVDDDLHHIQAREAAANAHVYESTYEPHEMKTVVFHDVPDSIQQEIEVANSPYCQQMHVEEMIHEEDGVYMDGDTVDVALDLHNSLGVSNRPYHPRESTQALIESSREANGMISPQKRRIIEQRAKRALRARMRYASMTSSEKAQQNARRAAQLRESRQRDEQLVHLAENEAIMDEKTRKMAEDAQTRRLRRAEQARLKYRKMNEDERRQYNAMRDAQRRVRRREIEVGDTQSNHGNDEESQSGQGGDPMGAYDFEMYEEHWAP